MYIPFDVSGSSHGWGALRSLVGNSFWKRNSTNNGSITVSELASQWSNPSDVSTILMIIGGDVVQSALAQSTGTWFTPVCFSFGWVSYAFIALLHVVGDGRLLPQPDYPVLLFNLNSGYARDNKNWVIGRLLRDGEAWIERQRPLSDDGIRISVFEAQKRPTGHHQTKFLFDRSHIYGFGVMLAQLTIASIPVILNREWGVLFITTMGTLLAQLAGSLPQWKAEKLPNRQHSNQIYALTTGNGSKDIMVIIGRGQCLDLEEFSVSDTPRNGRPWEKFRAFSKPRIGPDGKPRLHRTGTELRKSRDVLGLPYGFWVTRVVCVLLSIFWLLLLINVAAIKDSTWYLLLVGALGMFQNGILAAKERPPGTRNIPLRHSDTITAKKVMDGLMDFECTYKCGRPLLGAFFPGELRPDEKAWWGGNKDSYDKAREADRTVRGVPRSFFLSTETTSNPEHLKLDANSAPQLSELSSSSRNEKDTSNPFSDPEASKIAASRGGSLQKLQAVSWSPEPQVVSAKHPSAIRPMEPRRALTPPARSSLHPSSSPAMPISGESEQAGPSSSILTYSDPHGSTIGSLSVEEMLEKARSPDWAC